MTDPNAVSDGPAPIQLREYEYMVGHIKVTAQLDEAAAERLGAVPVGEGAEEHELGQVPNRENERMQMSPGDREGVVDPDDKLGKARTARNKRPH